MLHPTSSYTSDYSLYHSNPIKTESQYITHNNSNNNNNNISYHTNNNIFNTHDNVHDSYIDHTLHSPSHSSRQTSDQSQRSYHSHTHTQLHGIHDNEQIIDEHSAPAVGLLPPTNISNRSNDTLSSHYQYNTQHHSTITSYNLHAPSLNRRQSSSASTGHSTVKTESGNTNKSNKANDVKFAIDDKSTPFIVAGVELLNTLTTFIRAEVDKQLNVRGVYNNSNNDGNAHTDDDDALQCAAVQSMSDAIKKAMISVVSSVCSTVPATIKSHNKKYKSTNNDNNIQTTSVTKQILPSGASKKLSKKQAAKLDVLTTTNTITSHTVDQKKLKSTHKSMKSKLIDNVHPHDPTDDLNHESTDDELPDLDTAQHYSDSEISSIKKTHKRRRKSAFDYFRTSQFPTIKAENQSLNFGDLNKKLSDQWKHLSNQQKQQYITQANLNINTIDMECSNDASENKDQKDTTHKSHKRSKLSSVADEYGVKKPRNAYIMFSAAVREEIRVQHPGKRMVDINRIAGEQWNQMNDQQKKYWFDLASEDRQRFHSEKETYLMNKELNAINNTINNNVNSTNHIAATNNNTDNTSNNANNSDTLYLSSELPAVDLELDDTYSVTETSNETSPIQLSAHDTFHQTDTPIEYGIDELIDDSNQSNDASNTVSDSDNYYKHVYSDDDNNEYQPDLSESE